MPINDKLHDMAINKHSRADITKKHIFSFNNICAKVFRSYMPFLNLPALDTHN